MKLAGVKFIAGGATAASAAGVGTLGVYSVDWKEKPRDLVKTRSEDFSVTLKEEEATTVEPREEVSEQSSTTSLPAKPEPQPSDTSAQPVRTEEQQGTTCKVWKIDNKGKSNQSITSINWQQEKTDDKKASSTNSKFWDDVDKACKGIDGKKSWQGNVYVTKSGDTWNYSGNDQKDWTPKKR
ncbi:hypothetical protein MHF_0656 [Mycoplasma haemofelis Ohio2]|uniref:Uncharacterized protein n=1 Tax=Mycoplasma haemofelis (strain Ohio2) TaxID=859194 RepID=F6FI80_MYCHI|nr:hypothetical protein MHF_0656 [Mycoplasma haemofelis Ohio2]